MTLISDMRKSDKRANATVKQAIDEFTIDLYIRRHTTELNTALILKHGCLHSFKQCFDNARNQAFEGWIVTVGGRAHSGGAHHGVGLARSGLAVGQDRGVVSLCHHWV